MPLLETRDVRVNFGGHAALSDVAVSFEPGEVTGLIGPNGAGKTTLFNCMTGLQDLAAGEVWFDGKNITRASPAKRAHLGMARTFQRLELFMSLTVRDNVRVAGDIVKANTRQRIDVAAETDRILELTGLSDIAGRDVSTIPTGRARVVEVARALMTRPRVLLLDEPASGQTDSESEGFSLLLNRLANEGTAVCLVEHDLPLVMRVCSTIHVLDHGIVIASGSPAEVQSTQAVIDAYIGAEATA